MEALPTRGLATYFEASTAVNPLVQPPSLVMEPRILISDVMNINILSDAMFIWTGCLSRIKHIPNKAQIGIQGSFANEEASQRHLSKSLSTQRIFYLCPELTKPILYKVCSLQRGEDKLICLLQSLLLRPKKASYQLELPLLKVQRQGLHLVQVIKILTVMLTMYNF